MKKTRMPLETPHLAAPAKTHFFPPRVDYASLSVKDLLDAREAYHVQLASLDTVVATAIGRYLIHEDDWYANNPPDRKRPDGVKRVMAPRTLLNSVVRSWSWPAVLVFVRKWESREEMRRSPRPDTQEIPRTLYLPDGRMVPTCVVEATPDETEPLPGATPVFSSSLLGGGYPCMREHQGEWSVGTFACLVQKGGSYFALTNRHVAGGDGEVVKAHVRGTWIPVGTTSSMAFDKMLLGDLFPGWSQARLYLTGDAGLIRIADIRDWTSQAYGIGEIGEVFDATPQSVTLDLIDNPVRGFGASSGVSEGRIRALFYRYRSLGGVDYVTDLLIGPRAEKKSAGAKPLTRPGDSGTVWFYDPSPDQDTKTEERDLPQAVPAVERGRRARRLCPIAMQWGGQRVVSSRDGQTSFALATFLSSVCRVLDVEIVRDWSTGHDEYWGKIGHFAIGWKACGQIPESTKLGRLMSANQARIGFGNDKLQEGSAFRQGRDGFVPLADVPDYVWGRGRADESMQHFADVDLPPFGGNELFLESCLRKPKTMISARKWLEFFDGFAAEQVGPDPGSLPFRVWQIWEEMVRFARGKDPLRFVAAAGILAHYVGDASQPLHCSHLHHGIPPTKKTVDGRDYAFRREDPEHDTWAKTREYKIHPIYEESMLEVDALAALEAVDDDLRKVKAKSSPVRSGYDAALLAIRLMASTRERLSAEEIIDADDPSLGPSARARRLWEKEKVRDATVSSLADSVRLLAMLWQTAFRAGNGDAIAESKLVAFEEPDLEALYRTKSFLPSISLKKMAASGKFEPK